MTRILKRGVRGFVVLRLMFISVFISILILNPFGVGASASMAECGVLVESGNLRDSPSGKILFPVRKGWTLRVLSKKNGWAEVAGFEFSGRALQDKVVKCSSTPSRDSSNRGEPKPIFGFVPEDWIRVDASVAELDRVGVLYSHFDSHSDSGLELDRPQIATASQAVECLRIEQSRMATGPNRPTGGELVRFQPREKLGSNCESKKGVVHCSFKRAMGQDWTLCFESGITLTPWPKLSKKEKEQKWIDQAHQEKQSLEKKLSAEFKQALQERFVGWLPWIMSHPQRAFEPDSEIAMPAFLAVKGGSEFLLFFEKAEDAVRLKNLKLAHFRVKGGLSVASAPESFWKDFREEDRRDEEAPKACVAKKDFFLGVQFCRQVAQSERWSWVGSMQIQKGTWEPIDEDEMKKQLELLDLKDPGCCAENLGVFFSLK